MLIRNVSRKYIAISKEWEEDEGRDICEVWSPKNLQEFPSLVNNSQAQGVFCLLLSKYWSVVNLTLIGIFNHTWVRRFRLADDLAEEKRELLGSLHKFASSS